MQIDINKLKTRDLVTFAEQVTKRVDNAYGCSVRFNDGSILNRNDALWRLARLGIGRLPDLKFGVAVDNEKYRFFNGCTFTPETFLRALKQDVAALEAAGVEARSIDLCKNY